MKPVMVRLLVLFFGSAAAFWVAADLAPAPDSAVAVTLSGSGFQADTLLVLNLTTAPDEFTRVSYPQAAVLTTLRSDIALLQVQFLDPNCLLPFICVTFDAPPAAFLSQNSTSLTCNLTGYDGELKSQKQALRRAKRDVHRRQHALSGHLVLAVSRLRPRPAPPHKIRADHVSVSRPGDDRSFREPVHRFHAAKADFEQLVHGCYFCSEWQ